MNSKDFIKSKMVSLVRKNKFLKASYSFHELSSTHSVEIVPSEIYHNDEAIKNWELNLIINFIELYPNESICILTDDSILPIENVNYSVCGSDFEKSKQVYMPDQKINIDIFDYKFYDTFEVIFNTHSPIILEEITFSQEFIEIKSLPSAFNIIIEKDKSLRIKNNSDNPIASSIINVEQENIYSFAA